MPVIRLRTEINAPADLVFDLSRSIDFHKISTAHTNEEAVAGRTSGLIQLGETVTWRAKHLGFTQQLTTVITAFDRPFYFVDEMVKGAFHTFKHEHIFREERGLTVMDDVFAYKSPFGFLGRIADVLFLEKYMQRLLHKRNTVIMDFAGDAHKYKKVLP
ncbi:MAG: SRPBCC family protein [Flavobacterium sp.]